MITRQNNDLPKFTRSALISLMIFVLSRFGVGDEGHMYPHIQTPGFSFSQVDKVSCASIELSMELNFRTSCNFACVLGY